jgi:predicted secreted protein
MLRKAIITTIVAAVLWIAFYGFYQLDLLSFRRLEGT